MNVNTYNLLLENYGNGVMVTIMYTFKNINSSKQIICVIF